MNEINVKQNIKLQNATSNTFISSVPCVFYIVCILNTVFTLYGRKEGNVLFNDALNTFYLQLYGVRHMVKDHSDR